MQIVAYSVVNNEICRFFHTRVDLSPERKSGKAGRMFPLKDLFGSH